MTPLVLHIRVINPALIDLFCRCQSPVVFIIVVIVMHRSSSVRVVIMVSVIVRMTVVIKRDQHPGNGPLKSISQAEWAVSKMPLDNSDSDNANNKK